MAKETKPTPAPWEAKGPYVFAGNDCIGIFDTDNDSETRMKANARLSAAAPDMLIAVQRCLNFIEGTEAEFGEEFECGNLARAAIAKAEGRTDA